MKLVSKKLTLGLGCAVAALTFTACGGGVPDCDDSDVQDAVKKIYLEAYLKEAQINAMVDDANKEASNFGKKAKELFEKELKLTMSNFMTDRVDEKRNRVVCQARIAGDMSDDKVREALILIEKAMASKYVLSGSEVLTDGKFDDYIKRNYKSVSEYEKHIDKAVDKADEEFSKNQHNLEYTARRTDDGKLIVDVESGLPGRH